MHQIRDAQAAGYKEDEIVSSVTNYCMVPRLTLRGVFETTLNLSLAQLLQFLEAHLNERRSAEDMCNAMTSLV